MKTKTTGKFKVGDTVKLICNCESCKAAKIYNEIGTIHVIEEHGDFRILIHGKSLGGFLPKDVKRVNSVIIKQKLGVK